MSLGPSYTVVGLAPTDRPLPELQLAGVRPLLNGTPSVARAALSFERPDLVICSVPGAAGAAFLAEARVVIPSAIRVHVQPRAGGFDPVGAAAAHHVWTGPLSVPRLQAGVRRIRDRVGACPLPDQLDTAAIPVLTDSARTLLHALDSEDITFARAANLIEQDPGLTAAVLSLANSAFYGLPRRVDSVIDAARFVGTGALRAAVLSCLLFPLHGPHKDRALLLRSQGALRMQLVRRIIAHPAEDAAVAALLRDLGEYAMHVGMPGYTEAVAELDPNDAPLLWEAERYGTDRFLLGASLLNGWGLPHSVVALVESGTHAWPHPSRGLDSESSLLVAGALTSEQTGANEEALDPSWVRAMRLEARLPEWSAHANELGVQWTAA